MRKTAPPIVEGAGLGHADIQRDYTDATGMMNVGVPPQSLDGLWERLDKDVTFDLPQLKRWVRRQARLTGGGANADCEAIVTGLIQKGAVIVDRWKLGVPMEMRRNNDLANARPRMKDTRKEYEHILDSTGAFCVVERKDADAFRRKVALETLAIQERAAERENERIRQLKASIT